MPERRDDLRLTIPADARLAAMVREVAAFGARQRGRDDEAAAAFGRRAEDAFRQSVREAPHDASVTLTLTLSGGEEPLAILVSGGQGLETLVRDESR